MHADIVQSATTGHLPAYDELRRSTPRAWLCSSRIPGLGPKKIKALDETLAIESLADLHKAAESGQIAKLKGFGGKTEAKILEGIAFVEKSGGRILQSQAVRLVAPILEAVLATRRSFAPISAGSLRRRAETIGDLDILFSSKEPSAVIDAFVKLPQVATVLAHGPTKASVRVADGVQCDLRGVEDDQFAFALHYFTGSKAHNIAMRRRALARGSPRTNMPLGRKRVDRLPHRGRPLRGALDWRRSPPSSERRRRVRRGGNGQTPQLIRSTT